MNSENRDKLRDEASSDENKSYVSPAVIKRLPRYYRYLRELLQNDILRISSGELSKLMHVTASQIRQDLNCFGGFGQQGYGYNVKYLYGKIGEILGVSHNFSAVIIGSGNLGRALAASPIFERRGIRLTALFDNSPDVIGKEISGYTVKSMDELEEYCKNNTVNIAVLTLPKTVVRETAEQLADMGIKGLWNFASTEIDLTHKGVVTQNVHMGDSLMTLCYELTK